MGLDQFLTKKTYVGAEYKHRNIEGAIAVTVSGRPLPVQFKRVSEICESIHSWRKANQIHAWFVKNVQKGVDDCGEHCVDVEQLQSLINDCKAVLADHSKVADILPPQSGFFFGGTGIDDRYFDELQYTVEALEAAIAEDNTEAGFYYSSSW